MARTCDATYRVERDSHRFPFRFQFSTDGENWVTLNRGSTIFHAILESFSDLTIEADGLIPEWDQAKNLFVSKRIIIERIRSLERVHQNVLTAHKHQQENSIYAFVNTLRSKRLLNSYPSAKSDKILNEMRIKFRSKREQLSRLADKIPIRIKALRLRLKKLSD